MAVIIQNLKVAVRKRIEEFEPIARSRSGEITFSLVTSDSLQNVLRPAFLDRFSTRGLRRFDRIQVTADWPERDGLATLLVEEATSLALGGLRSSCLFHPASLLDGLRHIGSQLC